MGDERYTVSLMGSPSLRDAAGDIVGLPRKAFLLIALLESNPDRRISRSALAASLYEGGGQAGSMANLRQLLGRLQARQNQIGLQLLVSSQEEVRLVVDPSSVAIDVAQFRRLESLRSQEDLKLATDRYRGEFLQGFEGEGEALDIWLTTQRRQLRQRYFDLLRSGAANLGGAEGERALRQILQVDPYREDAWRELLKLVWQRDGLSAAELIFQEMCERFDVELGVPPSGETLKLMGNLRDRAKAPGAPTRYLRPGEALLRSSSFSAEPVATSVPRLCILMPAPVPHVERHAGLVASLIEDVTLGLCRLRSLAVIAPHTAWRLAETGARELDQLQLDYVVETDLRAVGDRSRLYVKLVRVVDRVMISGDVYELSDAYLAHHDGLSKLIVQALADGLERAEAERFSTVHRPDAYQWLLRGRQHMRVLDLPDLRRARKAFTQATECDPAFVPALAGTARTLILEWLLLAQTDQNLLLKARSIAHRAMELDPFSGEALRDYAGATLLLGGLDEAKENFSAAERLTPHHADILADHANALTHCSEMEAALAKIELAIALNPLPPDDYLWTAGGAMFFLNDFKGALSYLGKMKRQEPAYRLTAGCLAMLGRKQDAAFYVARALEDQPNFLVDDWVATIPLRSKTHIQHYADALSRAGFR